MEKINVAKRASCVVLMVALMFGATAFAQAPQPPPARPAAPEKALIPLKVQVTLSRYDGEKKIENLPFTLWVNANDEHRTSLNAGLSVPYGAPAALNYRNVGTVLTCGASGTDDGRFRVDLDISDSSIIPSKDPGSTGVPPTFQSFSAGNHLLLRDGQTAQFVASTDKVTGEVTKVEVTITVLK